MIARLIRKEILSICSRSHDSLLRLKSRPALEKFSWDRVWIELENHAPVLTAILTGAVGAVGDFDQSVLPSLCVAASILVKLSNPHVCLVQTVISLALKSGQATKLVRTIFGLIW